MALQFSPEVRNGRADAVEAAIGASAILYLRSGTVPANTAAADTGTLLVTIPLPANWMAAASGGVVAKAGTWSAATTTGGTVAHFRIKDSTGTTTHFQGTVTLPAGGGDMTVDNTTLTATQMAIVNTFGWTEGGA